MTDQIGGTTARSSGTVWIPDNPAQHRLGITDDGIAAMTYLDALAGGRAERKLRQAFVASGTKMLRYLETHDGIRFQAYLQHPDYRQDLPGAASGGRPLEPLPFDGTTAVYPHIVLDRPKPGRVELNRAGNDLRLPGRAARRD